MTATMPAHLSDDHSSQLFERVVLVMIVANTAVLALSFADVVREGIIEPVHVGFLIFFLGEIIVRLHRTGWNLREFVTGPGGKWNAFDTVIVAVSLLPLFVSGLDTSLLRVARAARLTHSVRHVGHLRLARFVPLTRLKKQTTVD
jgi:hypothetical protein